MDNLNSSAYPQQVTLHPSDNKPFSAEQMVENAGGFTKLELATLMIAARLTPIHYDGEGITERQLEAIAETSKIVAMRTLQTINR